MESNETQESEMSDENCLQTSFQLRNYQVFLTKTAKLQNSIVYLPTGGGKTIIACDVLNSKRKEISKPFDADGKRAFFLAPTKVMVMQLGKVLSIHTKFKVCCYTGDMNVDAWDKKTWNDEFYKYEVLVCTGEILRIILNLRSIDCSRISLLVFDECHHAVGDHPYARIMKFFENEPDQNIPLILGLTSVLLNSDRKKLSVKLAIQSLETTLRAKVITEPEIQNYFGYIAKPSRHLIFFDFKKFDLMRVMNVYQKAIDVIEILGQGLPSSAPDVSLTPADSNGFFFRTGKLGNYLKNVFVVTLNILQELGCYCGSLVALYYIVLLEKQRINSKKPLEIQAIIYARTELNKIRRLLSQHMGEETDSSIFEFSTDKVKNLIKLIQSDTMKEHMANHVTIVFVHEKVKAVILSYMFKRLSILNPCLNYIKTEFIVGTSSMQRDFFSVGVSNESIIKEIRSGNINLVIATNILEEGVDLKNCKSVASFDFPRSYTSYIQSKGRARYKGGSYFIFCDSNSNKKDIEKLQIYEKIENDFYSLIRESQSEEAEDSADDSNVETISIFTEFGKEIVLDGITAIQCLERYCAKLPKDNFTVLSPIVFYSKKMNLRKAYLQLPVSSGIRQVIESDFKINFKNAKRSAFLKAIKLLHEKKEINDYLSIVDFKSNEDAFDYLFPNYKKEKIDKTLPQPGTNKRLQSYPMKYAQCFINSLPVPGRKTYLHVVDFTMTMTCEKLKPNHQILYEILQHPCTFGILSTRKLTKVCQFPLFLKFGKINCNIIRNFSEFELSESELYDIKSFHFAIFKKVLNLIKNSKVYDEEVKGNCFFLVPVQREVENKFSIDWNTVRSDFCKQNSSAVVSYNVSQSIANPRENYSRSDSFVSSDVGGDVERYNRNDNRLVSWHPTVYHDEISSNLTFQMTPANYKEFVVFPNHRTVETSPYYVVHSICYNLSPKSPFPRPEFLDYADYFKKTYEKEITCLEQPLLKATSIPFCSNFNKCKNRNGRNSESSKKKCKQYEEHFVPELCDVFPFPRHYWLKSLLIPTVINRMTHIYKVEELRKIIAEETGLGVVDLCDNEFWEPLEDDDESANNYEEDSSEIYACTDNLNKCLPLSRFKEKFQKNRCNIVDPERHLYEIGACDLEYYNSVLNSCDDTESICFISKTQKIVIEEVETPTIKILTKSKSKLGPQLSTLIKVCTAKSANDFINYERMEILGDAFLKFAVSFFLFKNYSLQEGILTNLKGKLIGNRNLLYCGVKKNFPEYISVNDFSPQSDWNPPLFAVPKDLFSIIVSRKVNSAVVEWLEIPEMEQFSGELSENTVAKNLNTISEFGGEEDLQTSCVLERQVLKDKVISDVAEAFMGAYLEDGGLQAGLTFLTWLDVLPKKKGSFEDLIERPYVNEFSDSRTENIMEFLNIVFYSELESTLGYKFKNPALLLEAITHPSYYSNNLTYSYQRLEFLGDAVLDFLITCYLYENYKTLTPGQVTDIRSSLVNNITFACYSVRYEFHKYLLSFSTTLNKAIEDFVNFQIERNHVIDDNVFILIDEMCLIGESIDVPKALGDIFESIAGAIFLDSGNSLETVWNVYYKFMKREIDEFTKNVPKTAVRTLFEICSIPPKYSYKSVLEQSVPRVQAKCTVFYEYHDISAYGFGANKLEAKRSASKLVLRKIIALKQD